MNNGLEAAALWDQDGEELSGEMGYGGWGAGAWGAREGEGE